MWVNLVLGVCASICLNGGIALVALLRFAPALLSLSRYLVRLSLVCSFRLYRLLLSLADPYAKRHLNLELLGERPRLVASVVLSLGLAVTVLLVLHVDLSAWTLVPALGHGLLVGLLWDDLAQPGQLQLGVKLS